MRPFGRSKRDPAPCLHIGSTSSRRIDPKAGSHVSVLCSNGSAPLEPSPCGRAKTATAVLGRGRGALTPRRRQGWRASCEPASFKRPLPENAHAFSALPQGEGSRGRGRAGRPYRRRGRRARELECAWVCPSRPTAAIRRPARSRSPASNDGPGCSHFLRPPATKPTPGPSRIRPPPLPGTTGWRIALRPPHSPGSLHPADTARHIPARATGRPVRPLRWAGIAESIRQVVWGGDRFISRLALGGMFGTVPLASTCRRMALLS